MVWSLDLGQNMKNYFFEKMQARALGGIFFWLLSKDAQRKVI